MVLLVAAFLWKRGERLGAQQPKTIAPSVDFQIQIEESARATRQIIYEQTDKVQEYLQAQLDNFRNDVVEWRTRTAADIATLMERTKRR